MKSLYILLIFGAFLFFGIFVPANDPHSRYLKAEENVSLQVAHGLAIALSEYAKDHNGRYPVGKSSTEVFQQLVPDYISNTDVLCLPISGKTKAQPGAPIQPENVAWDITCPVDDKSPDGLPVIFMTGFKVHYLSGGDAVPLVKSGPRLRVPGMRFDWLLGNSDGDGMAVGYKDLSSTWRIRDLKAGTIPRFIRPDVDLAGKKYIQLTPTGPLP
jgi:hypothetical protein